MGALSIIIAIGLIILQIVMIVKFFEIASGVKDLRNHFLSGISSPEPSSPDDGREPLDVNHDEYAMSRGSTGTVIYDYYIRGSDGENAVLAVNFENGTSEYIYLNRDQTASFVDNGDEYIYNSKNDAVNALYEFLSRKNAGLNPLNQTVRKNMIRTKTLNL